MGRKASGVVIQEKVCPICGRNFVPAALHQYKVKGRMVCSYGCTIRAEKLKGEKK